MMTTSSKHEPTPSGEDAIEAGQETVAVAREERQQRGERYTGRHRPAPPDQADGQSDPI
jgi:hypothetical protein